MSSLGYERKTVRNFAQVLTDVCMPRAQTGDQKKLPIEGTVTASGVLKSTFH